MIHTSPMFRKLRLFLLLPVLCTYAFSTAAGSTVKADATIVSGSSILISDPYFFMRRVKHTGMLGIKKYRVQTSTRPLAPKTAALLTEPTEENLRIYSNPAVQDGGIVCIGHYYNFWTQFPGHINTWYPANCYINFWWGPNDVRVVFTSALHTDGWAALGVEVKDSAGNPFYTELSVTEDTGCDQPEW